MKKIAIRVKICASKGTLWLNFLNHPVVMVIKTIIDIGAVAYLIYYLIKLFERPTRSR
jgi:hypothetical protein